MIQAEITAQFLPFGAYLTLSIPYMPRHGCAPSFRGVRPYLNWCFRIFWWIGRYWKRTLTIHYYGTTFCILTMFLLSCILAVPACWLNLFCGFVFQSYYFAIVRSSPRPRTFTESHFIGVDLQCHYQVHLGHLHSPRGTRFLPEVVYCWDAGIHAPGTMELL